MLAGGLGTRLPEVSATRPKPMADVEGRPFLEYVLAHLRRAGVEEVVLAAGYRAEVIERHFGDGRAFGLRVRTVVEPAPLGTAGALRLALPFVGERALVLNGDTYVDVDVRAMAARHAADGAVATLAAVERDDASRFGRMVVEGARLVAFEEKRPERAPGLVSAGVYLLERRVLEAIPAGRAVSFEREVLPGLLAGGERVAVHLHRGYFEDIGVPESLAAFRAHARELAAPAAPRRAAFLDRDGVIVEDVHHLHRAEDLRLLPGAAAAIRRLRDAGWLVVVVTNQSAVARGLCSEDELAAIHARLRELLRAEGADWDALYYCPHHPAEGAGAYRRACDCRKPEPGMILRGAREHGIDLAASVLVGDKASDLEAGRRAGCRTILVRSGHGASEEGRARGVADRVHDTLAAAVADGSAWDRA